MWKFACHLKDPDRGGIGQSKEGQIEAASPCSFPSAKINNQLLTTLLRRQNLSNWTDVVRAHEFTKTVMKGSLALKGRYLNMITLSLLLIAPLAHWHRQVEGMVTTDWSGRVARSVRKSSEGIHHRQLPRCQRYQYLIPASVARREFQKSTLPAWLFGGFIFFGSLDGVSGLDVGRAREVVPLYL